MSGLTVRSAFVKAMEHLPTSIAQPLREPFSILWNGKEIVTGDIMAVPTAGRVILQRLGGSSDPRRQGTDLKVSDEGIDLHGRRVSLLRTWWEPGLPDRVEYDFVAGDGLLRTSNVYEMIYPRDVIAERWTENAAMLVENVSDRERIYRCSAGWTTNPTFDDLIYRLVVN